MKAEKSLRRNIPIPEQVIICPKCQTTIPLTEAISKQIRDKYEAEFVKKEIELKEKIKQEEKQKAEEAIDSQLKDYQDQIKEKDEKLQKAKKAELELRKNERELEERKRTFESEMAQKQEEFEADLLKKQKGLKEKLEKEIKQKAEKAIAIQLEDLHSQITEKDEKLQKAKKAELELRKNERELEERKRTFESEMAQKQEEFEADLLKKQKGLKEKLEKEIKQKAEEAIALEREDLLAQVAEKDKKLQDARDSELELRKQKRDLEESKNNFELEMTKKLDEEREKIKEEALKNAFENHRLKEMEKEKQIDGMRKQIDELKRKAEQGSQQIQGEVFEDDLEEALRARFPHDCIEPVLKGVTGADVLQKVQERSGLHCGTIIWESKNTKTWSDKWIEKLKDDQCEAKADAAVLMTKVLPKDVSNFELINGVWVTDYSSVIGLATALRFGILQVAITKRASEGKNEKMEFVYKYLSSQEFKQKMEAIVFAFSSMKKDLDSEKKAITKIWAKREAQLERVAGNTIRIYGTVQGLIGATLPQIRSLELEALTDGSDGDEPEEDENDEIFGQYQNNSVLKPDNNMEIDWYKKGVDLNKIGKYNDAIECYMKAIEINPKNEKILNNIGSVYYKLEKYKNAIIWYEEALKINPSNDTIKKNMIKATKALKSA